MLDNSRKAARSALPGTNLIDERLKALVSGTGDPSPLDDTIRYALLAPGKRLRPLLVLVIAGPGEAALDTGCAIEMVHTASLMLDDLPSMDDAALRRGMPTTHRVHGEAATILAAIALIAEAQRIIAGLHIETDRRCALSDVLGRTIGRHGMSGGQIMDVTGRVADADDIDRVNAMKTASLFTAAAHMGGVLRGMDDRALACLDSFARHFGCAFQLADDLLDHAPSTGITGKDVGADRAKHTMERTLGRKEAGQVLRKHLEDAETALAAAGLAAGDFHPFLSPIYDRIPA